jgi:transcription elongation factor GreA
MTRIPITINGAKALREELTFLKQVERPKIIQAIAEARALGDLSENAEYHAAKEQQGFIEGRIVDLENKLSLAEIIDVTQIPYKGKVIFGSTVDLINLKTDEATTYQIVGDDESDISIRKISVNSPIARAMIGKTAGDTITVQAPIGQIDYEIVEVRYI